MLVVAASPKLARLVKLALEPAELRVIAAATPDEARDLALAETPALAIVESREREVDGVRVCHHLRGAADVPVIFLSPDDDDASKVRGLRCADDYVITPFSLVELRARVEAVLRRARPCIEPRLAVYDDGLLSVDLGGRQVSFGGIAVALTPTESRILDLLVANRGRVLLHEDILARVWDDSYRDDEHLLRLHIANLRKKIEPDPARPRYVRTRRGLGYVFAPPEAGADGLAGDLDEN